MAKPFLVLDRLEKRFGAHRVLAEVSLRVAEGEVLALLGPSGSGKTTLLRLLAGFETPDAGRIVAGGTDVTAQPPAARGFGMVFQHYALFPHLTVGANVAFGLAARKWPRDETAARVAEVLALVDLAGFAGRRPGEISGGQQQRVALARALAPRPRLLLLDEPLSNLDPTLRERTRRELAQAIRQVGITTVLVTHEQDEAFELGDRVAVLHDGALEQVGTPEELYGRPATRFVATFVGRACVLTGQVDKAEEAGYGTSPGPAGDRRVRVSLAADGGVVWGGLAAADSAGPAGGGGGTAEALAAGAAVDLVVRPEALRIVPPGSQGALAGRLVGRRYAGAVTFYRIALRGGEEAEVAVTESAGGPIAQAGDEVAIAPAEGGPEPRAFPAVPAAEARP